MELTQFVSYLDYGVLGLSAIILILSFVLLSREQKRDEFRPEVAKAIRRYMMLALAFAGIGLVSTIVDGVMVRPAKKEKEQQEQRMDLLSDMISKEMDKKMKDSNASVGVKTIEPLVDVHDAIDDVDSARVENEIPIPDSLIKYNNVKKSIFLSMDEFGGDKELFSKALDKLSIDNKSVEKNKERILNDFDDLVLLKEKWLVEQAIPSIETSEKAGNNNPRVIVELPSELVVSSKGNNRVEVSNVKKLKKEVEMLRLSQKK